MKRFKYLLIILLVFMVTPSLVSADSCGWPSILIDRNKEYLYSNDYVMEITNDYDGVTYDKSTNTITLTNFSGLLDVDDLGNAKLVLKGDNKLTSLKSNNTNLTITGKGNLTINGNVEISHVALCDADDLGHITFKQNGNITIDGKITYSGGKKEVFKYEGTKLATGGDFYVEDAEDKIYAFGTNNTPATHTVIEGKKEVSSFNFSIKTGNGENKLVISNYVEGITYNVLIATSKKGKYTKVGEGNTSEYIDTNVNVGSTYYYKISYIKDGKTYTSSVVSKKASLNTPKIKVSSTNKSTLVISWDKVSGADGYEVYQATSKNGKYKKIATTNNTSYTKSKLTVGKKYYYKVKAYKKYTKKGYSSYSKVVSSTPKVTKPTIKAESYSYTENKISWNKVSGANGYTVYRSTSLNGKYKSIKTTKSTSIVDSKLTVGKNYYYKVKAYATNKKKKYYGDYSSVVVSAPKPATPKVYVDNTLSRDSLTIKITKVGGATGYKIYKLKEGTYNLIADTKELSYKDTDVIYGKEYTYKVVAYQNVKDKVYVSNETVASATVKPAKLKLIREQLEYNINVIGAPIPEGKDSDDIVISIYRKTGNNPYTLLAKTNYKDGSDLPKDVQDMHELETFYKKIMVNKNPGEVKTFMYIDDKLVLGETYKYKVTVTINGVESEYSDELVTKIIIAKSEIAGYAVAYNKVDVGAMGRVSGADGYEIYQATSKKGKYKKVYDGPNIYTTLKVTYNKNYYYKIRAYKYVNGKKVYGEYSKVAKIKASVSGRDKYPVKLYGDYGDYTIKSVSMTKKRTSGSYVYYKFKVKFKEVYSIRNVRTSMVVHFYDYRGNNIYDYTLYSDFKKGTRKNFSVTFEIKIPANAVYYVFE